MDTTERSREFGRHLHRIRTEVFEESLRDFAKRVNLSASYIGKLENGEVGTPRRETVDEMAGRLAMPADGLLLKAGYVPDQQRRGEDDEYLLMLIGTLTPEQKEAVRAYTQHVKDYGVMVPKQKRAAVRAVEGE